MTNARGLMSWWQASWVRGSGLQMAFTTGLARTSLVAWRAPAALQLPVVSDPYAYNPLKAS